MPRQAVVIAKVVPGEEERFRAVLATFRTSAGDQATRLLRNLQAFTEDNQEALEGRTASEVRFAFFAHLAPQVAASTLSSVMQTAESYRMNPHDLSVTQAVIEERELMNCIKRRGAAEPARREKPQVRLHTMLNLLNFRVDDPPRKHHLRAFWYVVVATGGRPNNVRRAAHRLTADGIEIRWGLRKGGRNGFRSWTKYLFIWSAPPPAHIRTILLMTADQEKWDLPPERSIASALGALIRDDLAAGATKFTSTAPRDRMSGVLFGEVAAQRVSENDYEWLMDHKTNQGRQHYAHST